MLANVPIAVSRSTQIQTKELLAVFYVSIMAVTPGVSTTTGGHDRATQNMILKIGKMPNGAEIDNPTRQLT
jgi:hypothetical protein